jgi:CO/xanthine dehydrogenase FAD-binding subunit
VDRREVLMDFLQPTSWADALAVRAERPDAVAIAGGTDVMVDLNFDRRRPGALLDLGRVAELREWTTEDGWVRLGAGVPYARIIDDLGAELPGLAMASRTVGSPQIRIRGTVGGNLGSASPAGDAHPPLLAAGAVVEVASAARGARRIPVAEFYTGVKRNALAPDELIAAVLVPTAAGPQQFCKVGTRNAMVIAVSAFACALHPDRRAVGTGIGSAAPTPRRAPEAEEFLAGELESAGLWDSRGELPETLARAFGERVAAAASPIDDVRGSAAYRRHSLSVMARRAATWAWSDLRKAA